MHSRAWVRIAAATLSGNSLRQTVHTHRASVDQAAKLIAALLRVARVTAGLVESNGSLLPCLWLTSFAGWLPRTGIGSGTLRSVIEYGLPLPFLVLLCVFISYTAVWWVCWAGNKVCSCRPSHTAGHRLLRVPSLSLPPPRDDPLRISDCPTYHTHTAHTHYVTRVHWRIDWLSTALRPTQSSYTMTHTLYNFDNKTANINTKNCSLSIVLTARDQKEQKSLTTTITTPV